MAKKNFIDNPAMEALMNSGTVTSETASENDVKAKQDFKFVKKEKEEKRVFSLTMKQSLYNRLKETSEKNDMPMGEIVTQLLEAAL